MKCVKRLLAMMIALAVIFCATPLNGLAGLDFHLPEISFTAHAEDEKAQYDLTYVNYRAKMLLGLQEIPEGVSSFNAANYYYNYYINEVTYNQCGSFLQSCYDDDKLMAEFNAWKAYVAVGSPSEAMENQFMKDEDYCMALILQAMEIALTDNTMLKYVKNETINGANDIIDSLCESLDVTNEANLVDIYNEAFGGSFDNMSPKMAAFWKDTVEQTGNSWLNISKASSVLGDILSYSTDIFEAADKIAMYASLSNVDEFTVSWLYKMQEQCPSDQVAMKKALSKVIAASNNNAGRCLTYIDTCAETAATWALKYALDEGIAALCASHPVVASIFAGFAAGKTLSDVFFNTSDICEQFAVLEWEFLLQDIAKKVVKSAETSFTNNIMNEQSAGIFTTSVDAYFKTITDVDADCMIKFLTELYSKGLINKIKSWLGYSNDLDSSLDAVEGLRSVRWTAYNSMNDYVMECYKLAYPEQFVKDFGEDSVKTRIPIEDIYAYYISGPGYPTGVDMYVGEFGNIGVFYTPENTTQKDIKVISDNEAVVITDGLSITAVGEGTANITVQSLYKPDISYSVKIHVAEETNIPEEVPEEYTDSSYFRGYYRGTIQDRYFEITGLAKNTNVLYIPKQIGSIPVKVIGGFKNNTVLKRVVIPEGVTAIDESAFEGCTNLIEIEIPSSVRSIGHNAFAGCNNLINLYYNGNVVDWCSINYWKEANKTTVKDTDVGSRPNSYAKNIYFEKKRVKSLNIPSDIIEIKDITFYHFIDLTNVTIASGVIDIGNSAFSGCSSLTNITISNSVTCIGSSAFSGCTSLESVTIPCSVEDIKQSAFKGCTKLAHIAILDGVKRISSDAFYGCTALTEVTIPDSVTSLGWDTFGKCSSLSTIVIGNGITSIDSSTFSGCPLSFVKLGDSMTDIPSALINKEHLKTFITGNNVERIYDNKFAGCEKLENIVIGENVKSIGWGAFRDCITIKNVTIPDAVIYIGTVAFEGCSSLKSIIIPGTITNTGSCSFRHCVSLTDVIIEDGVSIIGDGSFSGCTNLSNITIPESITTIESMAFYQCGSINNLYYNGTVESWCNISFLGSVLSADANVFFNGEIVENIVIPSSVTEIKKSAFYNFKDLKSITIPNSVTSIGDYAFYNCANLKSITIPKRVTSIGGYAFYNCTGLKSITISKSVTSIGDAAFTHCENLVDLYYEGNVEDWCSIDFARWDSYPNLNAENIYFCGELIQSIYVPSTITELKRNIFSNFKHLISVSFSNSITEIPSEAFRGCLSLKNVDFGSCVTTIGSRAFENCTSLESVTIPGSITSIGIEAFGHCASLTNVSFCDGVTNIGKQAFYCCENLKSVTIPVSVTSIGSMAIFLNKMYASFDLYYLGTEKQWEEIDIDSNNYYISRASMHYLEEETNTDCQHKFGKWLTIKEPTTTEEGLQERYCAICGELLDQQVLQRLPVKVVEIAGFENNQDRTVDYKTTITFHSNLDESVEGGEVHWYINGEDRGTGNDFTVSNATSTFTVQSKVVKNGMVIAESGIETVVVKNNIFQRIIAFLKRLFNPKAFIIDQR